MFHRLTCEACSRAHTVHRDAMLQQPLLDTLDLVLMREQPHFPAVGIPCVTVGSKLRSSCGVCRYVCVCMFVRFMYGCVYVCVYACWRQAEVVPQCMCMHPPMFQCAHVCACERMLVGDKLRSFSSVSSCMYACICICVMYGDMYVCICMCVTPIVHVYACCVYAFMRLWGGLIVLCVCMLVGDKLRSSCAVCSMYAHVHVCTCVW